MIAKKNRVNKSLFNKIYKEGVTLHSPIFIFKYTKSPTNKGLFAFIVPKTKALNAVKRNYLKRKGYNSLKEIGIKNGITGLFFFKKGIFSTTTKEIKDNIKLLFNKIK